MKKTIISIALATAALGFVAVPAAAETVQQVSVALSYDNSVSVADNYKAFKKQVRQTCRKDLTVTALTSSRKAARECRTELLSAAVKASGNREMIALHIGDDAPVQTAQVITR